MTKIQKLRIGALVVWCISAGSIAIFIYSAAGWHGWPRVLLSVIIACAACYGMTMAETPLIGGDIPAPWRKGDTSDRWIWFGAAMCLMIDVFMVLGGAGIFIRDLKQSASGLILTTEFGMEPDAVKALSNLIIVALSVLIAMGSELINAHADKLESRQKPIKEHKTLLEDNKPRQESNQQLRQDKQRPNLDIRTRNQR
jgi:hypothetical protein